MIDYKSLNKVELHLHLDGSVRVKTVSEILNISYEEAYSKMVAKEVCEDLNDYLTKFDLPIKAMQTLENLTRIAHELVIDLEDENVLYAEVRFAPLKHLENGLTPSQVIEAVLKGLKMGNIKTNLILCCMRNDSISDNIIVINECRKFLGKGVVGIDLAGAEALYPTSTFEELFEICHNFNIPFTIHAGEADGYDSIKSAILFKTHRIGHGVLCSNYDDLKRSIKINDILLEICPTSNIQTNIYKNYSMHPFRVLFNEGVNVCINTDNRTVSNTTLSNEYEKLNLTIDEVKKVNIMALKHSFLSSEEKEELLKYFY